MAKVTLTIEGEPFEVRQAIEELFGGLSAGGLLRVEEASAPETKDKQDLSSEEKDQPAKLTMWQMGVLWDELSEGAKRVLIEIARDPKGYPLENLAFELGVDARGIGGRLSSLGSALNRAGISHSPLVRDVKEGELVYRMEPMMAEYIRHRFGLDVVPKDPQEQKAALQQAYATRSELKARLEALPPDQEEEREKLQSELVGVDQRIEFIESELG